MLRHPDRYEMIATSPLYLQSKFELANMNTYDSVVVSADVCYVTAPQRWKIIISSDVMQSSFVSSWRRALQIPKKRFRKRLVMMIYHVLKH
jgi:hypothetical protein